MNVYRQQPIRHLGTLLPTALLVAVQLFLFNSTASGQLKGVEGRYHPLNQLTRPGTAAEWSARLNPQRANYHQPVRIELPGAGQVAFFSGPARQAIPLATPAVAGAAVGYVYRLRIGEMPEYPGIELFPSIEILDRLHPPPGKLFDFPIPIPITADEIELALRGSLVTKVIYLEQPQLAVPRLQEGEIGSNIIPSHYNALADADRRGRPMAILRLGGRVPSNPQSDRTFYGSGAKITLPPVPILGSRSP